MEKMRTGPQVDGLLGPACPSSPLYPSLSLILPLFFIAIVVRSIPSISYQYNGVPSVLEQPKVHDLLGTSTLRER
jgi:hypothetical protein